MTATGIQQPSVANNAAAPPAGSGRARAPAGSVSTVSPAPSVAAAMPGPAATTRTGPASAVPHPAERHRHTALVRRRQRLNPLRRPVVRPRRQRRLLGAAGHGGESG